MKKIPFLGRSNLPQSPFDISRDIRLADQVYDPKAVCAYATPDSLPKEAARALREGWLGMQHHDPKLFDITHPQVNSSRITIVGQHEMTSAQPKMYLRAVRELFRQGEHTREQLAPTIGATAFDSVAIHELPKGRGRLLVLQPAESSTDSGVEFLRAQRQESLEALAGLAIQSDGSDQPRHRYFAELPADVSVPLARFSTDIRRDYCIEVASYVQDQVRGAIQTMTATPLPPVPVEKRVTLEAFALGPTQALTY